MTGRPYRERFISIPITFFSNNDNEYLLTILHETAKPLSIYHLRLLSYRLKNNKNDMCCIRDTLLERARLIY